MNYTIVGKIINSHGIKGEVKVYPMTDDIERFSHLETAYIGESKVEVNLKTVRYHKGFPIIGFEEFNDINQILKFKDQLIYIDDKDRIILPKDHYFIYDLINCEVFDTMDNRIGSISNVIQNMGNDVYLIKGDNNKEYLVPAVKEFIKSVDVESKRIIIDPIEGMIEWRLMC